MLDKIWQALRGCKFVAGMYMLPYRQCVLCPKLDDGSASSMRSRRLISDSNYVTGWECCFHPRKWDATKTNLGSSPSVLEHLPGTCKHGLVYLIIVLFTTSWGTEQCYIELIMLFFSPPNVVQPVLQRRWSIQSHGSLAHRVPQHQCVSYHSTNDPIIYVMMNKFLAPKGWGDYTSWEPHWWYVNIGLDNGLCHQAMLRQSQLWSLWSTLLLITIAIWRHLAAMGLHWYHQTVHVRADSWGPFY